MGEWMSTLNTPSPLIGKMVMRQVRIRQGNLVRYASQRVLCMNGDVANMHEIEGADFEVANQDLIEYIADTF